MSERKPPLTNKNPPGLSPQIVSFFMTWAYALTCVLVTAPQVLQRGDGHSHVHRTVPILSGLRPDNPEPRTGRSGWLAGGSSGYASVRSFFADAATRGVAEGECDSLAPLCSRVLVGS